MLLETAVSCCLLPALVRACVGLWRFTQTLSHRLYVMYRCGYVCYHSSVSFLGLLSLLNVYILSLYFCFFIIAFLFTRHEFSILNSVLFLNYYF